MLNEYLQEIDFTKEQRIEQKNFLRIQDDQYCKLKFVLNLSFFGSKNQFTILREK